MLVLSRKIGERIHIGDDIIIEVVDISRGNRVRIGIIAPTNIPIRRPDAREYPIEENVKDASDNTGK